MVHHPLVYLLRRLKIWSFQFCGVRGKCETFIVKSNLNNTLKVKGYNNGCSERILTLNLIAMCTHLASSISSRPIKKNRKLFHAISHHWSKNSGRNTNQMCVFLFHKYSLLLCTCSTQWMFHSDVHQISCWHDQAFAGRGNAARLRHFERPMFLEELPECKEVAKVVCQSDDSSGVGPSVVTAYNNHWRETRAGFFLDILREISFHRFLFTLNS